MEYTTSTGRAVYALFVGAVLGALLTMGEVTAGLTVPILRAPMPLTAASASAVMEYLQFLEMAGIYAFVVFSIGLLVAGAPVWFVLHRFGCRSWVHAVVAGAVLTFLAAFIIDNQAFLWAIRDSDVPFRMTTSGWIRAWSVAAQFSLTGAAVGFVIWRIAYRRINPR